MIMDLSILMKVKKVTGKYSVTLTSKTVVIKQFDLENGSILVGVRLKFSKMLKDKAMLETEEKAL